MNTDFFFLVFVLSVPICVYLCPAQVPDANGDNGHEI